MSDLTYTVSMPFKRKGKDAMKDMEFILALSLDLKWFNPEQAKIILSEAQKSGLLKREGDLVRPTFDISGIEIPSGFKPELEKMPIFDRIIERIIAGAGIDKRKVIAMINKKQEDLSKQVEIEVSAILVAVENGVIVDDLIEEEYKALTTLSSS
ncbi:MAG: DUF2240 domain-containing protein [Candidatus Methanoperedenaceae archaeon]|nr:MAG: DUF2240 domain-containing protein [Candidatus Methanoperedenaceae archaeon]